MVRFQARSAFALLSALLPLTGVLTASAAAQGPAASRLAYVVDASDGRSSRIYLAGADGKDPKPFTAGAGRDRCPAFSPDGQWLAFQSTNDLGLEVILLQPLDGSAPAKQLALGTQPTWSPDGKRILFSRRSINEFNLYTILSGFKQRDGLFKPLAKGHLGRWSPEGKRIAAIAGAIVDGKDVWQLQVRPLSNDGKSTGDATATLNLPEEMGQVISLEWSPDGKQLLFSTVRQNQYTLAVVNADKPEIKRLPVGAALPNAAYGAWSPDGKQILFRAGAEAEGASAQRLYVMNADGTMPQVVLEPKEGNLRVQGAAWFHPPVQVAVQPPLPTPMPPAPKPPVPKPPKPMPVKALGPPVKKRDAALLTLDKGRSPVSIELGAPGDADFIIAVPALPLRAWKERRQGVGISLELTDGSLYRGTVIHSNGPWVTLQGRPKAGRVRLIDGKKIDLEGTGFAHGFKLAIRREGKNLVVAVNDEDLLTRPVVTSGVKSLLLTLENFDAGVASFNLGAVYYREWGLQAPPADADEEAE